jgi:hypothetical protein
MQLFNNNMKNNTSSDNITTLNYRITAQIQRLKINKSLNFQSKIMWKRRTIILI